jgi:hypothetical protein
MKPAPDTLISAENESRRTKHENGTRRLPYRRKRVRERKTLKRNPTPYVPPKNMKKGSDAHGTAENESGSAKHANMTQHPRYRQKRVRARKT